MSHYKHLTLSEREKLRQYRTNRQESLTRDFSVRKRCKTAGILCVFQGFTNEFLAKKNCQNLKMHLCGVALNRSGVAKWALRGYNRLTNLQRSQSYVTVYRFSGTSDQGI